MKVAHLYWKSSGKGKAGWKRYRRYRTFHCSEMYRRRTGNHPARERLAGRGIKAEK
jgi:hypothetical protein